MGSFLSLLGLVKKKDTRVLLLGLDSAGLKYIFNFYIEGKTTMIKQLGLMKMYTKAQQLKEEPEDANLDTVPTVGFNM